MWRNEIWVRAWLRSDVDFMKYEDRTTFANACLSEYDKKFPKGEPTATNLSKQTQKADDNPDAPSCSKCGKKMMHRNGPRGPFWGCQSYHDCRGLIPMSQKGETNTQKQEAEPF
jgi:hypothetical protein